MQSLPEVGDLTVYCAYGTLVCARVSYIAGRFRLYHLPEGGDSMRITFHIGNYTVTIIIKESKNRHSAK